MRTGRLAILLDEDDFRCLRECCPEESPPTLLVFGVDLHIRLRDLNVDHLTPWDLVGHDELPALRAFERELWDFWRRCAHVRYEGLDLLQILPYRHVMCMGRLAWVAWVLRRAFERLDPAEIVTFHEPRGHGLDQPPGCDKMPLLAAVARGMAEQRGLRTLVLQRPAGEGAFVDKTAEAGRPPVGASPIPLPMDSRYVLFSGSGPDLLRQLPLIQGLMAETDLDVVQVYKSADEETLARMRATGHKVRHESQIPRSCPSAGIGQIGRRGRLAFDRARRGLRDGLAAVFDNPYLDIHFDFVFGEYVRKLAEQVQAWKPFFQMHRPSLVVAATPSPLVEVAARTGVRCLTLSHGLMLMGNTDWFSSFPPSVIGAMSEKHRAMLVAAGIPATRIEVVGDPRLDVLLASLHGRRAASPAAPVGEAEGPRVCETERLPHIEATETRGRRILLVTGGLGTPSKTDGLPKYDWADAVRCFEEIAAMAAGRPEWRFLVQPHPRYDHPDLYERVNRGLPPDRRLEVLAGVGLEAIVPDADVVVACNVVTSALIEASLHGKPVYQLRRSMCWYDERAWGFDQWPHLDSVGALEAELARILSDDEAYLRRAKQTTSALEDFCGGPPRPSIPRCLDFIRRLTPLPARHRRREQAMEREGEGGGFFQEAHRLEKT